MPDDREKVPFLDAVKIPGRVIQNEKEGIFGKDHNDGIRRSEVVEVLPFLD